MSAKCFQVLRAEPLGEGVVDAAWRQKRGGVFPPPFLSALHATGWHFGFDKSAAYAFVVCPCVLIVHGHAAGATEVDAFDAPESDGGSAFVAFFDGGVDFFKAGGAFGLGLGYEA